ncbi:hypothetical protein M413DRAFT_63589 [Hebeloma cylindrosporum]|uniref:DUF6593 domain-containing protein n=1 Tax=Hebeloma cylindrosporum TaxID=76867 RepID=A0A0C2YAB6_HEBCY|nr:hypothetical protein M413DRAFT_63589 [Hebeloma cylindrosporum h7]
MFNPFDSWSQAGNGQSASNAWNGVGQPPSVFGALPYPSDPNYSSMVTFYFTSFNPNILNCSVVGPRAQTYYRIVTDNQMPGYSVIKNAEGRNVSLVEWQTLPMIEVRGVLAKQHVRTWLGLTSDRSSRTMTVRGMQYTWSPSDKSINLYAGGPRDRKFLARISRANGAISLDMTSDAMQLGLLDIVVVAAFLLQCGRNID